MQAPNPNCPDATVLVLAPIGNDAPNAAGVLAQAGVHTRLCANMQEVCTRADGHTGALLISEAALDQAALDCLLKLLSQQPPWSDIPVLLLTSTGEIRQRTRNILNYLNNRANVTLVERPLRVITLVSLIQAALRSRRHQYEVRDLLQSNSVAQDSLRNANALLADKAAQLETLVRQRTAKLRELVGELEAFSYSIAHDMRAPLRSLQGFSEILLTEHSANLDEDGRHLLDRIHKASARMDRLIQDVLSYSRVARAEFPLEKVAMEQLLRDIIDTYPAFAPDKAEIVLQKPFPVVIGNEAMLTQIFSNLMGNAVKFVAPGVRPKLKLWAEWHGPIVRILVQDNGIGIEPDQHEKIFGIFQQVDNSFEGTGIGLAIVKKAVERIGGRVGLQSELDRGTTFWVELPAA